MTVEMGAEKIAEEHIKLKEEVKINFLERKHFEEINVKTKQQLELIYMEQANIRGDFNELHEEVDS